MPKNKFYDEELEELLQLNGEEPENKCPFQIKKGLAKEWILYNKDTGLNIYHGSHKACNDLPRSIILLGFLIHTFKETL